MPDSLPFLPHVPTKIRYGGLKGLRQHEVAWLLGVHPMTVSKVERGLQDWPARCVPWVVVLTDIADGYQYRSGYVQRLIRHTDLTGTWLRLLTLRVAPDSPLFEEPAPWTTTGALSDSSPPGEGDPESRAESQDAGPDPDGD